MSARKARRADFWGSFSKYKGDAKGILRKCRRVKRAGGKLGFKVKKCYGSAKGKPATEVSMTLGFSFF